MQIPSRNLVREPAIGILFYQCQLVQREIESTFPLTQSSHYPRSTVRCARAVGASFSLLEDRVYRLLEKSRPTSLTKVTDMSSVDMTSAHGIARAMSGLYSVLWRIHDADNSSARPPLEKLVTYLAKRYLSEHCPADTEFVIAHQSEQNFECTDLYQLIEKHLRPLDKMYLGVAGEESALSRLGGLQARLSERTAPVKLPDSITMISFPGLDSEDSLLYPLMAHEMGHVMVRKEVSRIFMQQKSLAQKIATVVSQFPGQPSPWLEEFARSPTAEARVMGRFQSQISEFACDYFAYRALGPAYFFAFVEYMKTKTDIGAVGTDEGSLKSGYPPVWRRIRFLWKAMDERGELSRVREWCDGVKLPQVRVISHRFVQILNEWSAWINKQPRIETGEVEAEITVELNALFEGEMSRLLGGTKDSINDCFHKVARTGVTRSMIDALSDLAGGKSPSRQHTPQDVFLAAWIFELAHGEDLEGKAPRNQQLGVYMALCKRLDEYLEWLEAK